MAERGGQPGNQNAAKARKWRDAIERALDAWPAEPPNPLESARGLNEAAKLFVSEMMEKKDLGFFREFGDRIDGKPSQSTDLNVDAGVGLLSVLAGLKK